MGDTEENTTTHRSTDRGVTLVELLTVIAIVGIALGVPLTTMIHQRKQATVEEGQATVMQALNTTRSRAVAGVGGVDLAGHVACVRTSEVEIFTTDECVGACPDCSGGDVYPLPAGVSAEEAKIEFSRLRGESAAASIDVTGFGNTRTLTITDHGFIQ